MERKSLRDISWQVTEPEYRQDPALSYSTLARYEREGFNNLDKLFDRIESPSLVFGSAVDTIITGSEEEFNKLFMVAQLDNPPSDTLVTITRKLFDKWRDRYNKLSDIPDDDIISTIEDIQWNNHWLPKTRAKKIKEDCAGYYRLLYIAGDKTIISSAVYMNAQNAVDKLKSADSTRYYFEANSIFDDDIERLYQLKFKAKFGNVSYRCMADELVVIHSKKIVVPVDLKTSSKPEWDFYKSFLDWRYDIQARLYWEIIKANMNEDPYYKDFKLANYRFIVVNKKTLVPLVWEFESTQALTDIELLNGMVLRHPFVIGEELQQYLDNKPVVPNGINLVKPNKLENWIK